MSVNKVTLIGNVGNDPEIKHINEDTQVAKFSLATSEVYKNREGEKVTDTEWHNIVIWNKLAKIVESYVKKGSLLYLSGKIKTRSYEDKDNIKRYSTEIICNEMKMLGPKPTEQSEPEQNKPKQAEPEQDKPDISNPEFSDLPF